MSAAVTHFIICQNPFLSTCAAVTMSCPETVHILSIVNDASKDRYNLIVLKVPLKPYTPIQQSKLQRTDWKRNYSIDLILMERVTTQREVVKNRTRMNYYLSKLRNPFRNPVSIAFNIYFFLIFNQNFIISIEFTHIATSNTATDDITHNIQHKHVVFSCPFCNQIWRKM